MPKEPPSCEYWRKEPGVWIRVLCGPRTALYVPSEEDLAVEGKKRLGGPSGSPSDRSGDAAKGQAPTVGELRPTRCTSFIFQDGTNYYFEDEHSWFSPHRHLPALHISDFSVHLSSAPQKQILDLHVSELPKQSSSAIHSDVIC